MAPGFHDLVGLNIAASEERSAVVELEAGDDHLNLHGTVHGGAIATLADTAMAAAVAEDGVAPVTVEMKVTYLEPGSPGTLRAEGRVRKRGRRIIIAEAEITDGEGELVAHAIGTFTTVNG